MITMPLIDWHPMGAIPEDRKDGRQILLWEGVQAVAVRWAWTPKGVEPGFWDTGFASEAGGDPIEAVGEFWADIIPPVTMKHESAIGAGGLQQKITW